MLHVDAVTEVKFTLMPMTVSDVETTRPVILLCQFKRHLTSFTDTDSNNIVNCINVRLHGHTQVWSVVYCTTLTIEYVNTCVHFHHRLVMSETWDLLAL